MSKLREQYKEIYGAYPAGRMKDETIKAKIAAAEADITPKEEVKSPKEEVKVEQKGEQSPKVQGEAEVVEKNIIRTDANPVAYGINRFKRHEVFFKGNKLYWTENTIASMSKDPELRKLIEFPADSEYQHSSDYNKCRTCG